MREIVTGEKIAFLENQMTAANEILIKSIIEEIADPEMAAARFLAVEVIEEITEEISDDIDDDFGFLVEDVAVSLCENAVVFNYDGANKNARKVILEAKTLQELNKDITNPMDDYIDILIDVRREMDQV